MTTDVQKYVKAFSSSFGFSEQCPEMKYLRFLVERFVETRNSRVVECESKDMRQTRSLVERLFSLPIDSLLLCACIDGRVLFETIAGLFGKAFRTPAADISDALHMKGGRLYLAEGDFTRDIRERVKRNGKIVILLDSHTHCAAKGEEEKFLYGVPASDGGLSHDVCRKQLLADAIHEFARREYGMEGIRKVLVIQMSFDVHQGFLFMGLERNGALFDTKTIENGFTEQVLEEFSRKKTILSTAMFFENNGILSGDREKIRSTFGVIDFENHYAESMLRFWKGIAEISKEVLPRIEGEVVKVFPEILENSDELRVRSLLLLSNSILAFLLNANNNDSYPYKNHQETVVVVTNRARGPYGLAMPFPVNDYSDLATLSFVVGFAASIVRGNRTKGSFPKGEHSFIEECFGENRETFVKCPVPVFISERISGTIGEEDCQALTNLPWGNGEEWAESTSEECADFVRKYAKGVSNECVESIDRLRKRAFDMHQHGLSATGSLFMGQIALVSVLRTEAGKIVALFPFVLSGYSDQYISKGEEKSM